MPDFNSRRLHFVLFPVCCAVQRSMREKEQSGRRHFRFNPVGVDFLFCDDLAWKPASTAPPLGRIAEAPGELQYLFED